MSEEITATETAESPKPEEEITLEQPAQTSPAPASESIISTLERRAQRRGCGVLVLGALLGAVLGAVLALAALAAINGGTLTYNTGQIRRDMATAQEIQSNLSTQLESVSGQLEEVNGRLESLTSQSSESSQGLTTAEENIGQLQTDVGQIEADFGQVIEASQAVDEFLAAFRVMLEALPESTAVGPTLIPTSTP